jgi:hypothetical protein
LFYNIGNDFSLFSKFYPSPSLYYSFLVNNCITIIALIFGENKENKILFSVLE